MKSSLLSTALCLRCTRPLQIEEVLFRVWEMNNVGSTEHNTGNQRQHRRYKNLMANKSNNIYYPPHIATLSMRERPPLPGDSLTTASVHTSKCIRSGRARRATHLFTFPGEGSCRGYSRTFVTDQIRLTRRHELVAEALCLREEKAVFILKDLYVGIL